MPEELLEHSVEEEMNIIRLEGNDQGYLRMQQQIEREILNKRKREDDILIQEFLSKASSRIADVGFSETSIEQRKEALSAMDDGHGHLDLLIALREKKDEKLSKLKPNVVIKRRKVDSHADSLVVKTIKDEIPAKPSSSSAVKAKDEETILGQSHHVMHSLCDYGSDDSGEDL